MLEFAKKCAFDFWNTIQVIVMIAVCLALFCVRAAIVVVLALGALFLLVEVPWIAWTFAFPGPLAPVALVGAFLASLFIMVVGYNVWQKIQDTRFGWFIQEYLLFDF